VEPLVGFALAHAKQPPVHHLEGGGLEVGKQEKEPIFWCRQRAVLIDGELAGSAGFPIEAPRGHSGVERRLEGRDEGLEFLKGQPRKIQELRGAGLQFGEP
jgi:hypothetical protein